MFGPRVRMESDPFDVAAFENPPLDPAGFAYEGLPIGLRADVLMQRGLLAEHSRRITEPGEEDWEFWAETGRRTLDTARIRYEALALAGYAVRFSPAEADPERLEIMVDPRDYQWHEDLLERPTTAWNHRPADAFLCDRLLAFMTESAFTVDLAQAIGPYGGYLERQILHGNEINAFLTSVIMTRLVSRTSALGATTGPANPPNWPALSHLTDRYEYDRAQGDRPFSHAELISIGLRGLEYDLLALGEPPSSQAAKL